MYSSNFGIIGGNLASIERTADDRVKGVIAVETYKTEPAAEFYAFEINHTEKAKYFYEYYQTGDVIYAVGATRYEDGNSIFSVNKLLNENEYSGIVKDCVPEVVTAQWEQREKQDSELEGARRWCEDEDEER